MREVEKRKKVKVVQTDVEYVQGCSFSDNNGYAVTTIIKSDSMLTADNYLAVIVKELVPETLSEFRKENNLTKGELLDWLIENYK